MADAPNVVWSWDITKLATWARGVFLSLYVVLDLYSRYVVAWMVAGRDRAISTRWEKSLRIPKFKPAA